MSDHTYSGKRSSAISRPQIKMTETPVKVSVTVRSSASCLVHSHKSRSSFYHLENMLWSTTIVPNVYIRRVKKIICTCQQYKYHDKIDDIVCLIDNAVISALRASLFSRLEKDVKDRLTAAMIQLLDCKSAADMDVCQLDLGSHRLIYLLHEAESGNYDILDCNHGNKKNNALIDPEYKYKYETLFKLDCPQTDLGLVFGVGGRRIKPFIKEHDCELSKIATNSLGEQQDCIIFRLRATSMEKGEMIEDLLRQIVKRTIENRKKHKASVIQYWAMRNKRQKLMREIREERKLNDVVAGVSPHVAAMSLKENAQKQYESKYQHMIKRRDQRNIDRTQLKQGVLETNDAVCAKCMRTYDECVEEDGKQSIYDRGRCTYHPGYLVLSPPSDDKAANKSISSQRVMYKWTCCYAEISDKNWQCRKDSHYLAGCMFDCQDDIQHRHMWKPHKKNSTTKKNKQKHVRH